MEHAATDKQNKRAMSGVEMPICGRATKPGASPVLQMPYRQCPAGCQYEKEELDRMLKEKVARSSALEWALSVILVPKSDGSFRFCVDSRRLNSLTHRNRYPIPRIDDFTDSLATPRYSRCSTQIVGSGKSQLQKKTPVKPL